MAKCEEDDLNGGYLISGIAGSFDIRLQPEGQRWRATQRYPPRWAVKAGAEPGYGPTREAALSDFLKGRDQRVLAEALRAVDEGCPD